MIMLKFNWLQYIIWELYTVVYVCQMLIDNVESEPYLHI